jgi:hypothetical protein
LTDYSGMPLYLFAQEMGGMGYVPPITLNSTTYTVTINDQYFISLDGIELDKIVFQAGHSYIFRQDISSNLNYQLTFSSVP